MRLVSGEDTGDALVTAIDETWGATQENAGRLDTLEGDSVNVGENTARVTSVEAEIGLDENGDGVLMDADGNAISRIDDIENKLMLKKEYIDNLGAEMGINVATGEGTEANGMSRIDNNETRSMDNETAITGLGTRVDDNTAHLDDHEKRITTNTTHLDDHEKRITTNTTHLDDHEKRITTNTTEIARVDSRVDSNWDAIGANQMDIATNRSNINGLRKGLDVATAGVAAAMALAALPDVEGARSFGVGLGTFDGKTAVAVGFSYGTERFTFKVGAASSSGETGGSAGIGWSF